MGQNYSKIEIIERLKWFHGEEFDKYPLVDSFCDEKIEKILEIN